MQGFEGAGGSGGGIGGTENVGACRVAQPVDNGTVSSDKTANRGERLTERAHNEVYLRGQSEVVAYTAPVFAEHAEAMRFVYHNSSIVLMLQTHDFGQIGKVAFHGKDAVYNNQFHGLRSTFLQLAFKVFHIIVLVFQARGEGEAAAVDDGGVVAVVANDVVVAARKCGYNTRVHRKAGGEAQGFVFADKFGEFFFKLKVKVERTVEEARTGTAGTILAKGLHAGFYNTLVAGKTGVSV